ncbi:hypothetical protein JVT61DRAFT_3744 [Boletus reticuloceps]|uniref:Uncharacterized protein n=1 Tax=Boletus reticuloceps TaxID=495285 RepID=A0A8I3A9X7_9AGAM|nr:hypothetical protein JVT61DRAFT_3744 [Boletus reticuloceps]
MRSDYVATTNDASVLQCGLPSTELHALLTRVPQVELAWLSNNRTLQVTSPCKRAAPAAVHRGYQMVNDPMLAMPLMESQTAGMYIELASSAETGWDL